MRYIILLLLFFSFEVQSQVWHVRKTITYDNPANILKTSFSDFSSFRGEIRENSNELPWFSSVIELNSGNADFSVEILNPVFETFQGRVSDSLMISILADTISFSYSIGYQKKVPHIQIRLLPFRRNPENGNLQRLVGFIIRAEAKGEEINIVNSKKKSLIIENSVLASGSWYKIKVPGSGVYKLSFDQISSMSVGNPANVRIFGFSGEMLPEDFRKGEKDDLIPVQIYMHKGTDGIFNSGDYILFYSKGSTVWSYDSFYTMFKPKQNIYSDYTYYFVTAGTESDLPADDTIPVQEANRTSVSYDFRTFHESELENVLLSGKQWFGELFDVNQTQFFNFNIPGISLSQQFEILTNVMAKATDSSYFQLSYNNILIDKIGIRASNLSDYTSIYGYTQEKKTLVTPTSEEITLKLNYLKPSGNAKGWLDYFVLNARSDLRMLTDQLEFRDIDVIGSGRITQFTLKSADANTIIWDVTNQNAIKRIPANLSGSELSFKVATDVLREFVAFKVNGSFPSPVISGSELGLLPNQNLHASGQPDMIIVSHSDFLEDAQRLASVRRGIDGMEVLVVTPEMIYNEFSSGTPDISAIRNFIKMFYSRAGSDQALLPRFLLLFGDGSFDNKGILENSTNFILTYQSENSLSPISSYVSDDFFGLLDPGEEMNFGLLDIGVGRLPASSKEQSKALVDKILDYGLPSRMGDWRNTICFIGDDEDGNVHMGDADGLAKNIEKKYTGFNITKIYLDAFRQVSSPSGQRYPDVNIAIGDQLEKGSLILNYTGHGGIKGWAHELILDMNDIEGWKNTTRLPLFMTATCEFSRYDDIITSAGEEVLLNPDGGGIALLTTTRLVYSQPNRVLNEKFYEVVFEKDENGKYYRLGEIMEYTKNNAGSGINKRNFTLLGDPSMRLAYPEYNILADSINSITISENTDSLKALSKVTISGHLADHLGNVLTDFNGYVYPTVYDKAVQQQTLANDGGSKMTFSLRNSILYKGISKAKNGFFSFSFIVPKDIVYSYGKGKISFYAEDSIVDASGAYSEITIGGTSSVAVIDVDGPELKVYMNSPTFRSGDITDERPMLYVEVTDENGINTTGNGIGHDITATLDGNTQQIFLLNEYYQAYLNSFQGGLIRYPFNSLEPGLHTVNVKVWDIYNNSNIGSTDFVVIKSEDFILENLLNYPNPFRDYTYISFGHNQPGADMDITVDIFTMSGKLVSTIKAKEIASGYRSQNIYWDGSGASSGESIYIYNIKVVTSEGKSSEKSGKLILTN